MNTQTTERLCKACGQVRPHTRRASRCRECNRKYMREYYASNKTRLKEENQRYREEHRQERREWDAVRYAELMAWMNELKSQPCTDCGNAFPSVCMDWDHVSGEKEHEISRMVGQVRSKELILRELEKCELVCSNCHRIRTKQRRAS